MSDAPATRGVPVELRHYFWEYDPGSLSWDEHGEAITKRLLEHGGLDAVSWLRQHVGDEELRRFITARRGRGIPPRRLYFWGVLLDIPRSRVADWVAARSPNPWHERLG